VLTINVQPDTINDALFEDDAGDLDLDLFLWWCPYIYVPQLYSRC
jgi:hypothetical protein